MLAASSLSGFSSLALAVCWPRFCKVKKNGEDGMHLPLQQTLALIIISVMLDKHKSVQLWNLNALLLQQEKMHLFTLVNDNDDDGRLSELICYLCMRYGWSLARLIYYGNQNSICNCVGRL